MADAETYLAVLKASYDYEPQPDSEDELSIKEGQVLLLLERTDEDWWRVKIKPDSQDEDGHSGLVPMAYVEEAEHTRVVKSLYDYEASQSTELSISENDILYVYGHDDEWILVRKQSDESKVGYVPGNYVEEVGTEAAAVETPAPPAVSQIVIPPSARPSPPSRPVSTYVDPADRVAATRAHSDDIKTWAVSEVDKKGKKKKGTLGVGNGSIFFASEADKTPVQKWQSVDIQDVKLEKSKHVHIDIGGSEPINLHFNAGSKDVAEAITAKLESSRSAARGTAGPSTPPPASAPSLTPPEEPPRRSSPAKAVHFKSEEPEIIPPREPSEDGEEEVHVPEGEPAVVLYDFTADGEDELSVQEGESLVVIEKDSAEWWKCRNVHGAEGVVPAQYVELLNPGASTQATQAQEEEAAVAIHATQEAEERAEAERSAREEQRRQEESERQEKEREERERKKEAEQRAKAAAAAAEADRRRRERDRQERLRLEEEARAKADAEAKKRKERDSTDRGESSKGRRPNGDSSRRSSDRTSEDRDMPDPDKTRTWHDRTGQFRVDAQFLGFSNGKLRLHKVNGVIIEVPSEKMSEEDLKYVEKVTRKGREQSRRRSDEDDEPLEIRRRSLQPEMRSASKPKKPTIDWFDFFLNAGCDIDDCTRYASSFERDKIDEAILPDITDATMRALGLHEGDIIRVKKAIEQRHPKKPKDDALAEQVRRDEELARQLQAEENSGGSKRGQPPNLFAGANGALKSSMRRGRPQASKTLPLQSVDLSSISSASDQIQRTSSPMVNSPEKTSSPSALQQPARSNSAAPVVSGFDDDAWTNRPSSTKPAPTPTPPVAPLAPRAPSAPPPLAVSAVPSADQTSTSLQNVTTAAPAATANLANPGAQQTSGTTLAKTDDDVFEQLARLAKLRTQSPAVQQPQRAPSVSISSPVGYQQGMGMGPSPVPIGQHLQNQQPRMMSPAQQTGPRGPLAPVPSNQPLLQPLVPTTTGFNGFVPTRPQSVQSPFANPPPQQSPFQSPPPQPSFLSTQPTGFPGANQSLLPQQTGFPGPIPSPLQAQPTGFPGSNFGNTGSFLSQPTGLSSNNFSSGPLLSQPTGVPNFGGTNGSFGPTPSFQTNGGFGGIQSSFNPGFGSSPFGNGVSSPPPQPQSNAVDTTPANVFAKMKSGAFANDNNSTPQSADKYDALRPAPNLTVQPTGWGYQGVNGGFTGGYGYQH
ncbi:hypothetical protein DAEQUDRAFT_762788 [Daedalea quercina L-15889]|uniref:Actin cytoskeleton-regulatory complex protein SLA1 n=1 Tax=Daedalea quercina L-15889 TaxID=1314783 RepID=A0A165SU53_9APHY|nr:hypothetical protein DAEQUDRAFT_762788 [Daedalea quercina L-15889]